MNRSKTTLKIAHINDTHSYFDSNPLSLTLAIDDNPAVKAYVNCGGFSRISQRVKQLRAQSVDSGNEFLFLHAGDCFQGTLYFSLYKGVANAEMLNLIGVDMMTVGNHELDMGNEPITQFIANINFPFLAGNWDISKESPSKPLRLNDQKNLYPYQPETATAKYIVKKVGNSEVALFGLSVDQMSLLANPDPDTPFVLSTQVAINTVNAIREKGINKIILLSHLGYQGDKQLAESVDGISLIIGGHTHILQGDFSDIGMAVNDPYGIKVNQTHIVQSGFHSMALGHCDIIFNDDGTIDELVGKNELLLGGRLCVDATFESNIHEDIYQKVKDKLFAHPNVIRCKRDPEVEALLNTKYRPDVQALQKIVIGHLDTDLRHVRIPDERGPSEIAPLVTDSFLWKVRQEGHKVDFAIHNAGGVRTSLTRGKITISDITGQVLPFAVPIAVYKVKGRHIRLALEGAINNATNNGVEGTGSGSYPYVSELSFVYDAKREQNKRIIKLKIWQDQRWILVDDDEVYTGVSSAYTIKGKEGYQAFSNIIDDANVLTHSMADCFIDYIKNSGALNKPSFYLNQMVNNQSS